MTEIKKIIGIKCKNKYYISQESPAYDSGLGGYLINNKKPEKSFHKNWYIIDSIPETFQHYVGQPCINRRYELIDITMESKKTPFVLFPDIVEDKEDTNYWKDEYSIYKSLYKYVYDKQPDKIEDVPFEYKTIMEVKEIREYAGFAYDVQKTQWASDRVTKLSDISIQHQILDQIVFPDILLSARPCSLSPEDTYKIVRQYIKQNINYEVASITSDYNFCFTVKKKIALSEPEMYEVDINNAWFSKRKRKPKLETRYNKYREIECFNMAPKSYQNYRTISGFKGKDQDDLKNNIDSYCNNLVEYINEPLIDCPHCKGRGVIFIEKDIRKTVR